ncbi:MAG: CD225/dispanin family protein [Oscillospiraceae bacterium]
MFCKNCGASITDDEKFCPSCGSAIEAGQPWQQQQQQQQQNYAPTYMQQPAISSTAYLVWSIIVTILCCLPLGIPAIVFATKIDQSLRFGDIQGAMKNANMSKWFCIWGAIISVVVVVLYFIFVIGLGISLFDTFYY